MKHSILSKLLFLSLLAVSFSCRPKAESPPLVKPTETLQIKRFDQVYWSIDTTQLLDELSRLKVEYPPFLDGADLHSEEVSNYVLGLIRDTAAQRLAHLIQKVYPSLDGLSEQLAQLFATYHHYFPQSTEKPDIYSFISFLDYENRVIYQDSFLLLGLDMYLYPEFTQYPLPQYIRHRLSPSELPVDVAKAVIHYQLYGRPLKTLLDHIVFQGTVQCFIEALLPDSEPEQRLGMTSEQYQWCKDHETEVWDLLRGQQLLFEQDFYKFKHWVNEGPTTPVLPGSPGRLASYVGWRMVRSYLKAQSVSLADLLSVRDSRAFLKDSRYRP